jgi:hypothetical protein
VSGATVWRGDEPYLHLETVAEIYRVRAIWLREVAERGLLGPLESGDDGPLIACVQLDRVATIVRLSVHLGLDLSQLAHELD